MGPSRPLSVRTRGIGLLEQPGHCVQQINNRVDLVRVTTGDVERFVLPNQVGVGDEEVDDFVHLPALLLDLLVQRVDVIANDDSHDDERRESFEVHAVPLWGWCYRK